MGGPQIALVEPIRGTAALTYTPRPALACHCYCRGGGGGGEVVMVMVVWCGVVVVVVYRVMGSGRVGWVREKRVCYERRRTEGGL